jgi:hypothetical protein
MLLKGLLLLIVFIFFYTVIETLWRGMRGGNNVSSLRSGPKSYSSDNKKTNGRSFHQKHAKPGVASPYRTGAAIGAGALIGAASANDTMGDLFEDESYAIDLDDSPVLGVNPETGMPMQDDAVDISGTPYGLGDSSFDSFGGMDDSFSSIDDSFSSMDDY